MPNGEAGPHLPWSLQFLTWERYIRTVPTCTAGVAGGLLHSIPSASVHAPASNERKSHPPPSSHPTPGQQPEVVGPAAAYVRLLSPALCMWAVTTCIRSYFQSQVGQGIWNLMLHSRWL